MTNISGTKIQFDLPGLDCGACGYRSCEEMASHLGTNPDLLQRCIHLSPERVSAQSAVKDLPLSGTGCGSCMAAGRGSSTHPRTTWKDSLDRDFDFYLEHFPEDPGPREIIIPHNPMLTREMNIRVGETLIGRPLGMSCGCPVTHCGIAVNVEHRTGVIVWCVTGPLRPRQEGYKDLGYYIAEGYEGMVTETRSELKIGMRYFFQPRMCMLQWRHSGLLNYLNRTPSGFQVRVEGLWIG